MTKPEWWSTLSINGEEYFFKRDSKGNVHRIKKEVYKRHLEEDIPKFQEDGTTPSGPKYWTVGTTGKNGENDFVVMRKVPGDSNVYTLHPNDIHGDLAHDAAALKRIGTIINKHKATLRASDPTAEIPQEVSYNLNSAFALGKSNVMSLPTISTDSIKTAAAFGQPYAKLLLTNLKQISIPASSTKRRDCYKLADAKTQSEKFGQNEDSFHACIDSQCDFMLTIQEFDEGAYATTEKIITTIAPTMYPPLRDHWVAKCPGEEKEYAYWLYHVKGYIELKEDDKYKEENNEKAKKLVEDATFKRIYLGKNGEDNKFTFKDFLRKPDGNLVFLNCCSTALFVESDKAFVAGAKSNLDLQAKNGAVIGKWDEAHELNKAAIEGDIYAK